MPRLPLIGPVVLALASMAVLTPAESDAQASPHEVGTAADSLLLALHSRGLFDGAVVLGREEEVYARGFGLANVALGLRFTPDTPSDGGSIAKTLTSAAVLMLEDDGRLSLDDFVQQHLPEYPHTATRVRHLLTHSAGLPEAEYDFFHDLIPSDRIRTTSLFLEILRERQIAPAFQPGTRFRYSSLGFDVAALLVERLTGERWDDFLRTRIFTPLGMRSTFVRPARLARWPGIRTLSYRREGGDLVLHDVFDNEGFYGGSNLYFSARDLYRWGQSFYTQPVLSEAALTRGARAAVLWDPERATGGRSALNLLSWYYPDRGRRYHYPGSLQGFWSSVYHDDDQRYTIAYVSNTSIPQWLRPLLTRALIAILEGVPPAPITAQAYDDLGVEDLGRIVGRYAIGGIGAISISGQGDRPFVQIGKGIEYPAFFVGDGQLYVPGLDVWIGFPASATEPFQRLTWLSIFHVAEGERIP